MLCKIANQLKTFFEETEKYARSSAVLRKLPSMDQIVFYRDYYRAITYFNKGQELRKVAEDAGAGMGLAGGTIKFAIGILQQAEKMAKDSGTKSACLTRMKVF